MIASCIHSRSRTWLCALFRKSCRTPLEPIFTRDFRFAEQSLDLIPRLQQLQVSIQFEQYDRLKIQKFIFNLFYASSRVSRDTIMFMDFIKVCGQISLNVQASARRAIEISHINASSIHTNCTSFLLKLM